MTHVIVTHTHRDHSPGTAALVAATGAKTYGFGPHMTPPDQGGEGGDHGFRPDVDRARWRRGGESDDWRLTALHTPGHCANHLCFAMEGNDVLFSADHVMGWSTSVVSPPDGDMTDYMASLDRLIARDDAVLLPGHGPAILATRSRSWKRCGTHRLEREAKVLEALTAAVMAPVEDLVAPVYGPLDPKLVPAAGRSLLAHLEKLRREGVVRLSVGDNWLMA